MKNESKQLEIIEKQLNKALDIVLKQKQRYEELQSELCQYSWRCEYASDNQIASGLLFASGGIQSALENLYI